MPLTSGEQQRVIQAQRDAQHALVEQVAKQLNIKPREARAIVSETVTVGAPMIAARQGGGTGDVGGRQGTETPDPSSQFSLTFRVISGSNFVGLAYGSEVIVDPTDPSNTIAVTNALSNYPADDSDANWQPCNSGDVPYLELDVTYTAYPAVINSATFQVASSCPTMYEHDAGVGSSPTVYSQTFARVPLGLIATNADGDLYAQSSRNSQYRVFYYGQGESTNHTGSDVQYVWLVSLV